MVADPTGGGPHTLVGWLAAPLANGDPCTLAVGGVCPNGRGVHLQSLGGGSGNALVVPWQWIWHDLALGGMFLAPGGACPGGAGPTVAHPVANRLDAGPRIGSRLGSTFLYLINAGGQLSAYIKIHLRWPFFGADQLPTSENAFCPPAKFHSNEWEDVGRKANVMHR